MTLHSVSDNSPVDGEALMQVQPANRAARSAWTSRIALFLLAMASSACVVNPAGPHPPDLSHIATLLSPPESAIVDNGCASQTDQIEWDFDWSDVPNATAYQLQVNRVGSTYALIDRNDLIASKYRHASIGYIIPANSTGWQWRVRAMVRGEFQAWSAARSFSVEAMNTDCP